MIFTSLNFFVFLITTLCIFYVMPNKFRVTVLIIASAFFYMYEQAILILLLIFIITVNYFLSLFIEESQTKSRKKFYYYLGLLINIGVLVFFKYYNFIIENITYLTGCFNLKNPFPLLNIILPIGLSFFVFQSIGYLIDVFRGRHKAEKNFADFTLFILFFPKLLVGPIERSKNFLPQLKQKTYINNVDIILGSKLILWGLFRKLVVADRISTYTDVVFTNYTHHSGITMFVTILLYAIQLYADFSGYTDIARGIARLFGFNLMQNFNRPFFAKSVSDFWRRWHISLSSWVNAYIYNPIVLNRRDWGNYGVVYALLISFTIIGIWHGATWNFVLFGFFQSIALIFETITVKYRKKIAKRIPPIIYDNISLILTFIFISLCLVFFRIPNFGDAKSIISRLFVGGDFFIGQPSTLLFMAFGIGVLFLCDLQDEYNILKKRFFNHQHWLIQQIAYSLLIISILLIGVFDGGQFIYFQF